MNSTAPFQVVPLTSEHDRSQFNCGSEPLNVYFQNQVTQDIRRRVTACFIATAPDRRVAGYYTLASASLLLSDLPEPVRRILPRYPLIPAIRMGRLAVDLHFRGQGLGGALLADALARTLKSEIAAYALIVDAKNDESASFYLHHGMTALPDQPMSLFLPLATAKNILGSQKKPP